MLRFKGLQVGVIPDGLVYHVLKLPRSPKIKYSYDIFDFQKLYCVIEYKYKYIGNINFCVEILQLLQVNHRTLNLGGQSLPVVRCRSRGLTGP